MSYIFFASALMVALAAPGAQESPTVAENTDSEIVVMAQLLDNTRVEWRAGERKGKRILKKCKVTRSSGDAEIDAIVCKSVEACVQLIPLKAKKDVNLDPFFQCAEEKRMALLNELYDQRNAM